jgi:hypothetical protein
MKTEANFDRAVSVIGVGECGTRVALELGVELQFGMLGEFFESLGLSIPKAFVKLLYRREKWKNSLPNDARPNIYLGDFNRSNRIYVDAKKSSVIQQYLNENPNASENSILRVLRSDEKYAKLGFDDNDIDLIGKIRKRSHPYPQFEMLDFYVGDELILAPDGSGGIQYLSEAVTDNNSDLRRVIEKKASRIIFGIFGLGGGSGAGATYSILSKEERRKSRLSVGIGVLPNAGEENLFRNSGRFFVRYLSTDVERRFDKLMLFSNRAAHIAAECYRERRSRDNMIERELINKYIAMSIFSVSALNSRNVKVVSGKAIDTLDCKREWPTLGTIGLATKREGEPDFKELFGLALSPMSITDEGLCGLSVTVGKGEDSERIKKHISDLLASGDGVQAEKTINSLRSITGFYRFIRSVHVFYIVKSSSSTAGMEAAVSQANQLLFSLAGAEVQTGFSSFHFDGLNDNILLLLIDAGPSQDLIESVMRYLKPAFLSTDEVRTLEFSKTLQKGIVAIRDTESSQLANEKIEEVENELINIIVRGNEGRDDFVETRTKEEISLIEDAEWVPEALADIENSEYLVRTSGVKKAIRSILSLAKRSRTSFAVESFDEPIF